MVSSSTSEERTGQGYKGNSNGGNGVGREYKPRSYNKDYKSGTDGEKKDYRSGNNGERKDYRGQNNTERKDYRSNSGNGTERKDYRSNNGNGTERKDYRSSNGNGTERKDYRSYNGNGTERKDYRSNNSNGTERKDYRSNNGTGEGNRDYRKRDGSERPYNNNRFNKDEDDYGQSRNSRSGNNHGKDFKNSYNNSRDGRNGDSRGGSGQRETKVKEKQPDKVDIVNRLEKEKKVMQKKIEANNKKAKAANARPQVKVKRTNNIDWTKEYENDSFEDDDTSYTFY